MLSEIEHLAPAGASKAKSQLSILIGLCVVVVLISAAIGCGAASQAGTGIKSQIAVSVPSQSAVVGTSYNAVANVHGGSAPYVFSIVSGTLPPGTTLNPHTGSIVGIPTVAGNFVSVLSVSDAMPGDHGFTAVRISVAPKPASASQAHIVLSPATTTVASKGTEQFTAVITGTSNTAVAWSATAGTISGTGMFTAPEVTSSTAVTVTATSQMDSSLKTSATVNVTPLPTLTIETASLPQLNKGSSYNEPLAATGGVAPYKWSISAGALPSGIQLRSIGTVSGTTADAGSFPFTAKVSDSHGSTATRSYTLTVSTSPISGFDGPAELPRVTIQTAMANTPAPGSKITVNSGGNLQAALNSASCGDTILLQSGATFSGQFTFPNKNCDSSHWIIVRTSADDSLLPPEGSRLTPCYAGVSTLPGRPLLNCSSTKNVLAKLVMNQGGSGPVVFASGANHYRLIGLELTRAPKIGQVYALASSPSDAPYDNIIFDRMWIHGTAQDETRRGVQLGGKSTYVSAIDSFFTDFHCIALTGTCTDSQAVSGGIGTGPMGPYKISGNFLEAAGENILFGGGAGTATPADIEVTRNHMFKPLTWMKGQPGYVGGADGNPFIVKNLFELKNAQRVLLDSNVLQNTWGGFSQAGFGILLTPKNPGSTCAACQVTDVTVRYSHMSHVAAGFQFANLVALGGGPPADGQRYSVHDIIVDDIDGTKYSGPGELAEVIVDPGAPLLQNVTIDHITAFPPNTLLVIGDQVASSTKMKNFVFSNSIVNAGIYPVWSSGNGTANCAYLDKPLTTFNACFSPYSFTKNVLIGAPSSYPSSTWPAGNYFESIASRIQFVSYNGGDGGNYALMGSSSYGGAGTDGKPLGADVAALEAATNGVE